MSETEITEDMDNDSQITDMYETNNEDESAVPSTMDLADLMTMAFSDPTSAVRISPPKTNIANKVSPTQAKASDNVSSGINYSKRIDEKIASLLENQVLFDVTFQVGEVKREIQAHKLILALSSPVFKCMFFSSLLESQNVIEVPDCEPDAFQALVQFIYKNECEAFQRNVTLELGLNILYTARKYAVKGLEDICLVVLSSLITNETVFNISNAANLHSLPTLESECWAFIEDHAESVLKTHLDNMEPELITLILKNDRLKIKEAKLFELIYAWVENTLESMQLPATKENKLKIGDNVLDYIRYPTMSSSEFADLVVPTGILTVDQIARIFTYISQSQEIREKYRIKMEFSTQERTPRITKRNKKKSKGSSLKFPIPTFIAYELDRNGNNSEDRDINLIPVTSSEDQPQDWQERSSRRSRRSRRRNR